MPSPIPITTSGGHGTVVLSASGLPPTLTLTDNTDGTGEITGTIDLGEAANSPFEVEITATDDLGRTSRRLFTFTVNTLVVDALADTTVAEGGGQDSFAPALSIASIGVTNVFAENDTVQPTLAPDLSIGSIGVTNVFAENDTLQPVFAGPPGVEADVQALTDISHTAFDLTAEGFADTTSISTLTDQTGNGNDLTQGTGANQPTAQTQDGTKVARFDGADDFLTTPSTFTAVNDPVTVVTLQKKDSSLDRAPFGLTNSGGLSLIHAYLVSNSWSTWNGLAGGSGSTGDLLWHVMVTTFVDTPSTLYKDGGTADHTRSGNPTSFNGFSMGDRFDGGGTPWDGDIAYAAVYEGDLVTDDLSTLNAACQALADRVGITWTDIT